MPVHEGASERPPAYQPNSYPWNIRRVPLTVEIKGRKGPHPGRHCAVFVVHGMGQQQRTDTALAIRSGEEDALESIRSWQKKHLDPSEIVPDQVPPPFVYEGYWADYDNIKETFPEDWKKFNDREKGLFDNLWHKRAYSASRTCGWFLTQQVRLLFLAGIPFRVRLVYLPLQLLFPVTLGVALLRYPKVITRVLADVRIYAHPKGMSELAMVQRTDFRIGREFLRLIGLDWDFRPLPNTRLVMASGKPVVFNRIVWVSHSLGTVVSYNVLSDIFRRAEEVERNGSAVQKAGVNKFRSALRRFVTLGSPLDKFAALFPEAVRAWPQRRVELLFTKGDRIVAQHENGAPGSPTIDHDWWINFYNVLDPVSGALENPLICGHNRPLNCHSFSGLKAVVPGFAHTSYWSAKKPTRYVLARTYGREYLHDKDLKGTSDRNKTLYAALGYLIWIVVLYGIVAAIVIFRNEILKGLYDGVLKLLKSLVGL